MLPRQSAKRASTSTWHSYPATGEDLLGRSGGAGREYPILRCGDLVILGCKWEEASGLLQSQLDERLPAFSEALGIVGVLQPARQGQEEDMQASLEAATDLRWRV